ncbi:MAG TPA: hypothetical protein VIY47_16380 [Ignavibacteriaceae bacterium]
MELQEAQIFSFTEITHQKKKNNVVYSILSQMDEEQKIQHRIQKMLEISRNHLLDSKEQDIVTVFDGKNEPKKMHVLHRKNKKTESSSINAKRLLEHLRPGFNWDLKTLKTKESPQYLSSIVL